MNAIKNGKYDIREGHPFPESKLESLNNASSDSFSKGEGCGENIETKDKNDLSNLEEKFQEDKVKKIDNKGIIPAYATNDIMKQGPKKDQTMNYELLSSYAENLSIIIITSP